MRHSAQHCPPPPPPFQRLQFSVRHVKRIVETNGHGYDQEVRQPRYAGVKTRGSNQSGKRHNDPNLSATHRKEHIAHEAM